MSVRKPISDLDMPARTQEILIANDIKHLDELEALSHADLDEMGISEYGSRGTFNGHHTIIVRALEKEGKSLSKINSRAPVAYQQQPAPPTRKGPSVTAVGLRNLAR